MTEQTARSSIETTGVRDNVFQSKMCLIKEKVVTNTTVENQYCSADFPERTESDRAQDLQFFIGMGIIPFNEIQFPQEGFDFGAFATVYMRKACANANTYRQRLTQEYQRKIRQLDSTVSRQCGGSTDGSTIEGGGNPASQ